MSFLTTTIAAELGHNTSANSAYKKANFPANFTGTTHISNTPTSLAVDSSKYDDGFNPVTPGHVSSRQVKDELSGFTGTVYVHSNPWFHSGGGGGHIDVGENSDSNTYIDSFLQDVYRRCGSGAVIVIDYYGRSNYIHGPTLKMKARITALGLPLKFVLCMDHQAYTSDATLTTLLTNANTDFFGDANYEKIGGLPSVQFFDVVGGVNYATVKSSVATTIGTAMDWVFENSGSLANAYADACFEWFTAYSDGYHTTDRYKLSDQSFFLSAVHSSSKGSICCLSNGFNGYLTRLHEGGYADGKTIPKDSGAAWLARQAGFLANIPAHCRGVQLVTWEDFEEGTALAPGIENDVVVTASISGSTLSWGITGGTAGVFGYKILASPDGVNAAILATPSIGTTTFDLSTIIGWDDITLGYSIYVVAVGKAMFRDHSILAGSFTPATLDIIVAESYAKFFLSGKSSVVQLELLEISHPNFSKVYRIVRNAIAGVTVTLEDSSVSTFDYYPCQIIPNGSKNDLDQTLQIALGDLGQILPQELDRVVVKKPVAFHAGALLGAWVDNTGQLVAKPFLIGTGGSFYVPLAATHLQMGIDDDFMFDNSGVGFSVVINGGAPVSVGVIARTWTYTAGVLNTAYPYSPTSSSAPISVAVTPGQLLKITATGSIKIDGTANIGNPFGIPGYAKGGAGSFVDVNPGPGTVIKPSVVYRVYRSDDLTEPLDGPYLFQANSLAFQKEGATFECTAPRLNLSTTGEIYTMNRFPMLRGFL
jgi:hypothetical protein